MTFLSQGLILVLALGSSIIIARTLGPKGQGIYSMAIMLPAILVALMNMGVGSASIFYIGKRQYTPAMILGGNIFFAIILSLLIIGTGYLIINFFAEDFFPGIPTTYLFLSLALIPFQLFFSYGLNFIVGIQNIKNYNLIRISRAFLFVLVIIVIYLSAHMSVAAAMIALCLSFGIASIPLFLYMKREADGVGRLFDKQLILDFLVYGSKINLANLLVILHKRIDIFLINFFLNPVSVGYYTIAAVLSERIWMVSQSAGTVLFPKVSSEVNDNKLKEFTPRVCRNVLMVTFLIAIVCLLLSRILILFFYSEQYVKSVVPFQILLFGMISISGSRILSTDLAGRNKINVNIWLNCFSLVSNIILNLYLIPLHGITGAALATTISYTMTFVGRVIAYSKISGNKVNDIILIKKSDLAYYQQLYGRVCGRT